MIKVKTMQQLKAMRGEIPQDQENGRADDAVVILANEIKEATASHQKLMMVSVEEFRTLAQQFARVPVKVNIQQAAKVTRWKFNCEYDDRNRIKNITAEASE